MISRIEIKNGEFGLVKDFNIRLLELLNMSSNNVKNKKKMNILSFDIGIKNLSYCLIEGETLNNHIVKDWGIWDLRMGGGEDIPLKKVCCGKTKNNKACRLKALYEENISDSGDKKYYCKNHKVNHNCLFEEEDLRKFGKMKKSDILKLIEEKSISLPEYSSVYELKKIVKEIASKSCLMKIKKPKKCKSFPLDKLHKNLYDYINLFLRGKTIHLVQIENQPVRINATMKTIQVMLYSIIYSIYYQSNKPVPIVTFMNAKHKGTVYTGESIECNVKDPYRRRKYLSIKHSEYFLEVSEQEKWSEYFHTHKKKDDLADAYLMCLFSLK